MTDVGYGDIRDRIKDDGSHWIQPKMLEFLNTKMVDSNELHSNKRKRKDKFKCLMYKTVKTPRTFLGKVKRLFKSKNK